MKTLTAKESIVEGNKLIAEFMGGKWEVVWWGGIETKVFNYPKWHTVDWPQEITEDTFRFHASWDELMPVVEKIEGLLLTIQIERAECFITWNGAEPEDEKHLNALKNFKDILVQEDSKIKATWLACVNFIKWYNQEATQ